jgi:hypothetical protein
MVRPRFAKLSSAQQQAILRGPRRVRRSWVPTSLNRVIDAAGISRDRCTTTWLVTHQPDAEALPQLVRALIGMIRGALAP